MKKPTYPRYHKRDGKIYAVTIKTKNGQYKHFLNVNSKDPKVYKRALTTYKSKDDIWWTKSNFDNGELIDKFVYEDKNVKATVKIYFYKNASYIKWVSGKIDKSDRVEIRCNAWRSTKPAATPFTPTGYRTWNIVGGCTKKQAIKLIKNMEAV